MGTRNLTCVYINGEMKVSQYGQFDGYPDGQGKKILNFLRGEPFNCSEDYKGNKRHAYIEGLVYDETLFKKNVLGCTEISQESLDNKWKECGPISPEGFVSLEVSNIFEEKYPQFSRRTAGVILPLIQVNGPFELKLDIDFAGDSLFCEWCYVIDYDSNQFEVYRGFQTKPNNDRFAKYFQKSDSRDTEYYSIALAKSWSLNNLPTFEKFLQELS